MKNTRCPYCGKQLSYFGAFAIRRKGEYFCNKCKKESNIQIKKTILLPLILLIILSAMILGFFLLMTDRENLWFILLVCIPFFIFYLITPMFIRLKPKKKHMDVLYDTQMVETPTPDPDPTMAKTSKVVPAFVDDIVLDDEEYKPNIDASVFNAIKEERKVVSETEGGTRAFDKFENISSKKPKDATMAVSDIKSVSVNKSDDYNIDRFM